MIAPMYSQYTASEDLGVSERRKKGLRSKDTDLTSQHWAKWARGKINSPPPGKQPGLMVSGSHPGSTLESSREPKKYPGPGPTPN